MAERAKVALALDGMSPTAWGQSIDGVGTHFESADPAIALTFDACGGPGGNAYDAALIELLRAEQIRATLFVTARWIDANPDTARALANEPLFLIENHGDRHRPCSVNGRRVYGITGTRNVTDAINEIWAGERAIEAITGNEPAFYRPGTAYFDDVCVHIAEDLGAQPIGFSVIGDAGGGFNRAQIATQIGEAPSGSIILAHFNHPHYATREGLKAALPRLRERGVRFVRLDEVKVE